MSNIQSAAVARSWLDPEVAAKRSAKHGLMVDGQIYSSAHQALKALGIDTKHHIPWRTSFKDLVDRQTGILIKGYPMLDGNHRDVMLTEPGNTTATVHRSYNFKDIDNGTAYVTRVSSRSVNVKDDEQKSVPTIDAGQISEVEAEFYRARKLDPNEPWFVYLIVEEGRLARQFKVGMALDIENRMASLTQGLPWVIEAALAKPRPRYLAYRLEQQILNVLKAKSDCHLAGEFFQIDQRWIDVAASMVNRENIDDRLNAAA